jgi:hypothetical protein
MEHQKRSHIVFIDEAGFMLEPLRRRSWAPRGKTPIIRITSPHERISAIGAMTIQQSPVRFGFLYRLLVDNANFNGQSVAAFVKACRQRLRGPITLIWDECRIHWAWPIKRLLRDNPDINVEPLPPYAPELNPVDYVWSYLKWSRLPNFCPLNLGQLRKKLVVEMNLVANQPELLQSLFRGTGLTVDG